MTSSDKKLITYAKVLAKADDIYWSPDHDLIIREIITEKHNEFILELKRKAQEVEGDSEWAQYAINSMEFLKNIPTHLDSYNSDDSTYDEQDLDYDQEDFDHLEEQEEELTVVSTLNDILDIADEDNLLNIMNAISQCVRGKLQDIKLKKQNHDLGDLKNSDIDPIDFIAFWE